MEAEAPSCRFLRFAGNIENIENMPRPIVSLPLKTLRQVAADAQVNERTAARVVLGLPTRPACRERVLEVLATRGVDVSTIPTGAPGSAK